MDASFHEKGTHLCSECRASYKSRQGLRKHVRSKHMSNRLKYTCDTCNRSFLEKHQLTRAYGATRWPSHGMHYMQEAIYDRICPEKTHIWTSREGQLSMHNLQSRVLHRKHEW